VAKDERDEATQGTMQRRVVPAYNGTVTHYFIHVGYELNSLMCSISCFTSSVSGSRGGRGRLSMYSSRGGRGGTRGGGGGRGGGRGGRGGGFQGFGYGGKGYRFYEMDRSRCMGVDMDMVRERGRDGDGDRDRERDRRRSRSRSRSPPPYSATQHYAQQSQFNMPMAYAPGLGRGALGFETCSDVGPVPGAAIKRKRRNDTRENAIRYKAKDEDEDEKDEDEEGEGEGEGEEEMDMELVVEKNSHQKLSKLVMLQRANGSFELNDKLAKLLGVPLARLEALLSSLTATTDKEKTKQQVWATAMALAYMEIRLASIADDWAMMADKSRRWLRGQTTGGDSTLAQVAWLDEAKKVLTTKA
jgi:hypothetical protein